MLCYANNPADVTALANCLLESWNFNYTVYYALHYILGGAGVLMPILSTILSDVENRNVRRLITGLSAASVSLYAFLVPLEKVATYKSAHTELRQMLVLTEQMKAHPATKEEEFTVSFANAATLMGVIQTIEERILNSEKTSKQDAEAAKKETASRTASAESVK